ncbi:DUF4357 domain-containing protein [Lederbergia galactosidilytica]|uniref:DUF4357 domain-containing protein n=1 Tax=Lederbergia galactosidilytica TaxID=217031 RepID=A0A177ZRB2_9BACI|nr:DUF4357 domain-containing protein [Lederbergia galactosidilytica]KRG12758.1 hypothetical protein ACA30_17795 [Virgibacillus soli]MBP1917049.1 hypothetical protein [Lederbergia galactosidilytica]OAK70521.1 hypothetical protein ABB05_12230 [Lederbergia galactosidilytica]
MKLETLQKALALSSANTTDEFVDEVLTVYIEQKEAEAAKRGNAPVHYRTAWGRTKEFKAEGFSEDGRTIHIKEGSDFASEETPSLTPGYRDFRRELIEDGVVKKINDEKYVFDKDYTFLSFSTAASVIRGVVLNGTRSFKKMTD